MRDGDALAVIDSAVREHQPSALFALFSGGHDSLTATVIAARHPRFTAAVHIDTGIGIDATRDFVRATCLAQGWPLLVYGPPERLEAPAMGPTLTYEDMVLAWGFPGPPQHKVMYTSLKERALRAVVREHKTHGGDRILFSTGIRIEESVRRMRNFAGRQIDRNGASCWANPIWNWSKAECHDLMTAESLPRNLVVDLLHKSGECLCGAFAAKDEMRELETWFPETATYLHDLERRVEIAGRIACVWGRRRDNVHLSQERLFPILPLCSSCTPA